MVEVIGVAGESNGYGDSMDAFRNAHETNSRIILNLAQGRKKNAAPAAYNPDHPDNQWPVHLYHAAKGDKTFGVSLVGLQPVERKAAEEGNKAAVKAALKEGWREEPYAKPQVAVLDPAAEKAALMAKNQELEGKIVAQGDMLAKVMDKLQELLAAKQ